MGPGVCFTGRLGCETISIADGLIILQDSAELIEKHQKMVFRTLARLTGERDVEDLAQEVFLRLLRGLPSFRSEAKITTFLYRIIVNVVNDEWKKRQAARQSVSLDDEDVGIGVRLAGNEPDPGDVLDRLRLQSALRECLRGLSERERMVLILYSQEQRSYEEIAEVLGLPLGTVKTHLHRARQKLKIAMRERMRVCRVVNQSA